MKRKSRIIFPALLIFCAAVLLFTFSDRIFWSLGTLLVNSQPPQKADMILVIGGDERGNRILRAAELAREGYASKILVSGMAGLYGHHESDLAIDFAVRHGYPRETFIAFHYPALSTVDEAGADVNELRHLGVHKYLLITSEYHSARASRIFRRAGRDLEMHSVTAHDPYWQNGQWWKNREGRKIWFYEMVKTVTDFFRI